ncbi:META domain-containing protein [Methanoculleus chikugoensis]|uniref:META domain-containing protein n=1 Tax=Methanoculleus chikugoensis TaxID=118126 RepID=UPI001FB1BD3E|nr:META domain-containing protein [Methanoculleus chikugoensis]
MAPCPLHQRQRQHRRIAGARHRYHPVFDGDGTLSGGSAGCNAYSAPYRVNETGLSVDRVIATKASFTEPAGVMEQEKAYLDLLRSAAGYRIVGDTLAVIDGSGRAILFFTTEG